MEPERTDERSEPSNIVSPFENAESQVPAPRKDRTRLWIVVGFIFILVAIGAVGGVFLSSYLNDPYRTMETFPVQKFLDNPRSLTGTRFKAELSVEADLAYEEEVGRLMLFSTRQDSRPIAVMIPDSISQDIYFTKGQSYIAELEVKEGGLIYANSCRKN